MDKRYQPARDFFLNAKREQIEGTVYAWWYNLATNPDKTTFISSGVGSPCHSSMIGFGGAIPICMSSGFSPNEEQMPAATIFWKWITGEESPWKSITKDIELIVHPETQRPVGWILGEKVCRTQPFTFLKNFAIATRTFTEHWKKGCCLWEPLTKRGMHGTDVLYFVTMASKGLTEDTVVDNTNLHGGWHWPLCDYYDSYGVKKFIDWKRYRSGNINLDVGNTGQRINGYFMHSQRELPKDYRPWKMSEWCKPRVEKGRFAVSSSYFLDDAIKGFYDWQDKHGIRDSDR